MKTSVIVRDVIIYPVGTGLFFNRGWRLRFYNTLTKRYETADFVFLWRAKQAAKRYQEVRK